MFKSYPKIHRLGKDETAGILEGVCHVEEKIDGANASIWYDDGIKIGSRSRELPEDESFNGFREWAEGNEQLQLLFQENPYVRLYGEWLVRHTIQYDETVYKQFYLFDIIEEESGDTFFSRSQVHKFAKKYDLKTPEYYGEFTIPTVEQLMEFVGKSTLGPRGEGIVIKNEDFINTFGDHQYAKIVTESFKEDNAVTFGGNNKYSDCYWEVYVVNKYMSLARIEKIMHKIQPLVDKRLDLEHTPRIIQTAYHDMLTEEIWDIAGKVEALNFKSLKRIATKKAAQIYKDIINNSISIADLSA